MMTKFIMLWLFISIAFECFGDYFVKKWSLDSASIRMFVYSIVFYNLMLLSWMIVIWKSKEISIVGTIWLLLGHGCLIMVGAGIFHEPLTIKQWCGIGLAAVSLVLMTI